MFGNKPTAVDHELIPTAVFSTPEIGTVGLPEARWPASATPSSTSTRRSFRPLKHTLSGRDERMLMKLLVDARQRPRASAAT